MNSRIVKLICAGGLMFLLIFSFGCSAQYRQMRKTQKISRQNMKRQDAKKSSDRLLGAGELAKDDVNYKDLDKIKTQCLHVNKNGKRCTNKARGKDKYCWRHNSNEKY
ncbi:MAG: hypothetical protein LBH34_04920 [Prevotellaceae bacterium]|nr:hypothetical protein [Prevotellaceae bacterium]